MRDTDVTPWTVVVVLIGTGVVSSFQVGKVPGVLPVLSIDMELTLFAASLVISMLNVIGALAGVLMGAFADRIGYRRLIITGLSLMVLRPVSLMVLSLMVSVSDCTIPLALSLGPSKTSVIPISSAPETVRATPSSSTVPVDAGNGNRGFVRRPTYKFAATASVPAPG